MYNSSFIALVVLSQVVLSIFQVNADDSVSKKEAIAMSTGEDCFHLGAKALIRNKEGKVLLLQRERRSGQTYWDLPGGRLQKGETLLEGLQREVEEEVGLHKISGGQALSMHLTKIRIPQGDKDVGLIISVYAFDVVFDFTPQLSDEHSNYGWFEFDTAIDYLLPQYPEELISDLQKSAKLVAVTSL